MKKGFTLIELVIILAIVSILFSITSLSFKNSNYYSAKKELQMIKKDLEFTRNLSMARAKESEFLIDENQYEITCGDFKEKKEFSKYLVLTSKGNTKSFQFSKRGTPKFAGSGTIMFMIKDKDYKITVEPVTGKVNLYEI